MDTPRHVRLRDGCAQPADARITGLAKWNWLMSAQATEIAGGPRGATTLCSQTIRLPGSGLCSIWSWRRPFVETQSTGGSTHSPDPEDPGPRPSPRLSPTPTGARQVSDRRIARSPGHVAPEIVGTTRASGTASVPASPDPDSSVPPASAPRTSSSVDATAMRKPTAPLRTQRGCGIPGRER